MHIFGDNQQLAPWSAASDMDAPSSDVDAPGGDALGSDCEHEAIVRIRHASECATVGHTGKVTVKTAPIKTDPLPGIVDRPQSEEAPSRAA